MLNVTMKTKSRVQAAGNLGNRGSGLGSGFQRELTKKSESLSVIMREVLGMVCADMGLPFSGFFGRGPSARGLSDFLGTGANFHSVLTIPRANNP